MNKIPVYICYAIFTCQTKSSKFEKEQVRLQGFIKIPVLQDEMSIGLRSEIEEIASEFAIAKLEASGIACAVKIKVYPHLDFDFRSHDECLFPDTCTVGSAALIECIKGNYGYFREQISLDNYRNAIKLPAEAMLNERDVVFLRSIGIETDLETLRNGGKKKVN